jgi:ribulose bisphosphate carboxylase small subunit
MNRHITRQSLLPSERERMEMNSTAQEKANQKRAMVRKLLSMGYKMGYQYRRKLGNYDGLVEWQINMQHVNEFFNKHGHVKKDINNMTHAELVQSVTQFQQVLNDFLKRV